MRQAAEDRLYQLGDRGLAEKADADRGHGDADLAGGERLVDVLDLVEHLARALLALAGERLDPAAAGANKRKLGSDKQPVDRDQQEEEEKEQDTQVPAPRLLRGRSSSTGTLRS